MRLEPFTPRPLHQMNRQRIDQLIRKMHANERLKRSERFAPFHRKPAQRLRLSRAQFLERLDDHISNRTGEMLEHITGELPIVRALLDNREFTRRGEQLADLRELARHHSAEDRPDAHAGEVVALSSYMRAPGAVVTML